ncbi:hypothetical protein A9Q91_05545 [Candidatus Gracilibacteria bacterium 28_42_T64]|nr:hypothetical protein A9Q91_05545 [Candidatus Gracilibacteria bacterium 28_42_T64]
MSQVSVNNEIVKSVIPKEIIAKMEEENKTLEEVLSEGVKYKKGDEFTYLLKFAGEKKIVLEYLGMFTNLNSRSKKIFAVSGDIPLRKIDYVIARNHLDAARFVCLGVENLKYEKRHFIREHREQPSFWNRADFLTMVA